MESEKIKKFREKFEEAQKLDSIEDLNVSPVIDRRKPETKKQYENNQEGELLQELDETRDYEQKIVIAEKIRQLRGEKKENTITKIVEDIKLVIEKNKQQIQENNKNIETLKQKNEKLKEEERAYLKEIQENEGIIELKKSQPSSKIYISAKEENKKLLKSKIGKISAIKRNDKNIKSLESKNEELDLEILGLDDLLCEIQGIKREEIKNKEDREEQERDNQENIEEQEKQESIKQQEDEMWEQFRTEQARTIEEEIDREFEEKYRLEKAEEEKELKEEQAAIEQWLYGEVEKDESIPTSENAEIPSPIIIPLKEREETKKEDVKLTSPVTPKAVPIPTPVRITQPKNNLQPTETKRVETIPTTSKSEKQKAETTTNNGNSSKTTVAEKREIEQENSRKKEEINNDIKVTSIGFHIKKTGKPIYYVVYYEDGERLTREYNALEYIQMMTQEKATKLKNDNVRRPSKYYDLGLERVLKEFDNEKHTDIAKKYMEAMKKDAKTDRRGFSLGYNFSNSTMYSAEDRRKLNYLKRIANANNKSKQAHYVREESIIYRIWRTITNKVKLLMSRSSHEDENKANNDIRQKFELFSSLPNFDIEKFIKDYNLSEIAA